MNIFKNKTGEDLAGDKRENNKHKVGEGCERRAEHGVVD